MGATEQCLGKVEQCVTSPGIAKIEQASELQAGIPAMLGQYVSLLQVVMTKDWSRAVLKEMEARPRCCFQTAYQRFLPALLTKLLKRLVERRAHIVTIARLRPPNALGDDVTVSSHGNAMQAPQQFAHLPIGIVDAGFADEAPHRHAGEPRRERKAERRASSTLVNAKPTRNCDVGSLADPAGNQSLLRHDPRGIVGIDLEYERLFVPRKVDTVDIACTAMKSREPDRVERTIEIADNRPDLLKFEIDGQTCHHTTPFLADQLGAIPGSSAPEPCRRGDHATGD
jgi:hypothetical protein